LFLQIDFVRRHLDCSSTTGDAGQHKHSVRSQNVHRLEDKECESCRFENDIKGAVVMSLLHEGRILGAVIAPIDVMDQIGIEVGRPGQTEGADPKASNAKGERGENPNRPCAKYRGAPWMSDAKPPLDLVGLGDPLFDHAGRLKQHANRL